MRNIIFSMVLCYIGPQCIAEEIFHRYTDYDELDKTKIPTQINGAYAKSVGIALAKFEKENSKYRFNVSNYSIYVFEVNNCYFVQISIPLTKEGTGVPSKYCINKNTFDFQEVPSDEEIFKRGRESY